MWSRIGLPIQVSVIVLTLTVPVVWARSKARSEGADPAYVSALAAADKFLQAWQARDEEAGVMLLSDRLRQHTNEEVVRRWFAASGEQGFEVSSGKKLGAGRYQFAVELWTADGRRTHRRTGMVVLVSAGGEWLVEKMP